MGKRGSKKGKGRGGGDREDFKEQEKLQAIVLADSFTTTFRPITRETPKVLMPLVTVPMLEYTLEFLAANSVDEVFVFCVAKDEQVRAHLHASKWTVVDDDEEGETKSMGSTGPIIRILSSSAVSSAGDALREIDAMGVIRSDPFILLSGDVISNMNLKAVVEAHKARRASDRSALMTMVFKKAAVNHRTRALDDDLVIALNADSQQLLRYDNDVTSPAVTITRDYMREHPRVAFRYDLLDCHIDVCSPEVLVHFSDNYDYTDVRQDYVHNEVQNKDMGWQFYAHIIHNEYAARVHDPRTYDSVARDIVGRWTYPMVPDTNVVGGTHFSRTHRGLFKERRVRLARSATVGDDSVVGDRTVVGEGSKVSQSVIGRRCRIGKGCVLESCYVWDDVVIEDGCVLRRCIVCDGVVVRAGAEVQRGSILSYNVVVGAGFKVSEFTRLTKDEVRVDDFMGGGSDTDTDADTDGESSGGLGTGSGPEEPAGAADGSDAAAAGAAGEWKASEVGEGGEGRVYPAKGESDDEDAGEWGSGAGSGAGAGATGTAVPGRQVAVAVGTVGNALRAGRGVQVVQTMLRRVSTVMGADEVAKARAQLWSVMRSPDEDGEDNQDIEDSEVLFQRTLRDMVVGGAEEGHDIDTIGLEISCYRHAENRSFVDVLQVIVPTLLEMVPGGDQTSQMKATKAIVDQWAPLLTKFIQGLDEESTVAVAVQDFCLDPAHAAFAPCFGIALMSFYNTDLTSEEALQAWATEAKVSTSPDVQALYNDRWTQMLLQQIAESDSDSDDDDDGDDDSDSGSGSGDDSD